MKRFLFISTILHGALLLLLFSWEIPLADRLFPRNIIQVSLVETIEQGIEEKKPQESSPARVKSPVKKKIAEKKDPGEAPKALPAKKEEKREEGRLEERRQVVEATRTELTESKEEKSKMEEKDPPQERVLKAEAEEPVIRRVETTPPVAAGENRGEGAHPGGILRTSAGREGSGVALLASTGLEMEREGVQGSRGGNSSGQGKGGEGAGRVSSLGVPSREGDSILSEIMRKIEGAKRYPRVARKMGIEGKATVRFQIKPNGKADCVEVVESSGSEILDEASLETVHRAAPLPFKEGWLKVVIVFKIL